MYAASPSTSNRTAHTVPTMKKTLTRTCMPVLTFAFCLIWSFLARAAIIAPSPGQTIETLEEHAMIIFDPLTGTETLVLQHIFSGTSRPFGILIPTPTPTQVSIQPESLSRAIHQRLHPKGPERSTLDVQFISWAASCAIRQVGDEPNSQKGNASAPTTKAEGNHLGSAPEPVHDWILKNGFTLSPAQAVWIRSLQNTGWSLTGIVVRPMQSDGQAPPSRLKGPVISLTHAAEEPVFAAGHPPFALHSNQSKYPDLEIAVLTEWSVNIESMYTEVPFYSDMISGHEAARLSSESTRSWAFRRDGSLTAFHIPRDESTNILRFTPTDPRPTIKPVPAATVRPHHLRIPVEAFFIITILGVYGLIRAWRSDKHNRKLI